MANLVENPFPKFTDVDGSPLEDGYVYIGEVDLNPITNPLQAYWDADLTIPASNIRTKGGYPSYNGAPGRLYTSGNYSILVHDKRNEFVYYQANSVDYFNSPSGGVILKADTLADLRGIAPTEQGLMIQLGGYTTLGDQLVGPMYWWDNTESAADNGYSVIKPTAVTGNGRWKWVNKNAPFIKQDISTSVTLSLNFNNNYFLFDTTLGDLTIILPDGDYEGQRAVFEIDGGNNVEMSGTGVPSGDIGQGSVIWNGSRWVSADRVALKQEIDTTSTVTLFLGKNHFLVDTSVGSVTVTIPDGSFIGQEVLVECSGSGLAYAKGVGTLTDSRRSGIYSGASDLGTPISDKLVFRSEWNGSEWKPVNEVTADYVSSGFSIRQDSNGYMNEDLPINMTSFGVNANGSASLLTSQALPVPFVSVDRNYSGGAVGTFVFSVSVPQVSAVNDILTETGGIFIINGTSSSVSNISGTITVGRGGKY